MRSATDQRFILKTNLKIILKYSSMLKCILQIRYIISKRMYDNSLCWDPDIHTDKLVSPP